jgi:UDP-GlcNAc:undecaprenyl-phosphate GlcNAc-1-phosphate transferase
MNMTPAFPFIEAWMFPIISFTVAWIVLAVVIQRFSGHILDHPNERSLHHKPMPRTGAIGVLAGLAATAPFAAPGDWWPLWLGASILVAVSFVDDLVGLPILGRLLAHFAAATVCVASNILPHLGPLWTFVMVVGIVWMINLYNFMDGMDGLAGGMGVFGFGVLALIAWLGEDARMAIVCASIASAAGAFLFYNFYPAKIFLGDSGSTALGFLAASLGLIGWRQGNWSIGVPLLVFSPFIMDASLTLAKRAMRGEKIWQAHRSHYYQRVALLGWGHRRTVLAEYALMCACAAVAFVYQYGTEWERAAVVVAWCALLGALIGSVEWVERAAHHRGHAL